MFAMSSLHGKPVPLSQKSRIGPTQGLQNMAKLKEAWIMVLIKLSGEEWWGHGMTVTVTMRWMRWI